jgi:hypothetical protein
MEYDRGCLMFLVVRNMSLLLNQVLVPFEAL